MTTTPATPATAPNAPRAPKVSATDVGKYVASLDAKARKAFDLDTDAGFEKARAALLAHIAANPAAHAPEPDGEPSTTHLGLWDAAAGQVTSIATAPTSGRGSVPAADSPLAKLLDRLRAKAAATPGLVVVQIKPR